MLTFYLKNAIGQTTTNKFENIDAKKINNTSIFSGLRTSKLVYKIICTLKKHNNLIVKKDQWSYSFLILIKLQNRTEALHTLPINYNYIIYTVIKILQTARKTNVMNKKKPKKLRNTWSNKIKIIKWKKSIRYLRIYSFIYLKKKKHLTNRFLFKFKKIKSERLQFKIYKHIKKTNSPKFLQYFMTWQSKNKKFFYKDLPKKYLWKVRQYAYLSSLVQKDALFNIYKKNTKKYAKFLKFLTNLKINYFNKSERFIVNWNANIYKCKQKNKITTVTLNFLTKIKKKQISVVNTIDLTRNMINIKLWTNNKPIKNDIFYNYFYAKNDKKEKKRTKTNVMLKKFSKVSYKKNLYKLLIDHHINDVLSFNNHPLFYINHLTPETQTLLNNYTKDNSQIQYLEKKQTNNLNTLGLYNKKIQLFNQTHGTSSICCNYFNIYVLNYLEIFIKRKIWIKIRSNGGLDNVYKTVIDLFLKKNLVLYNKSSKLIPVHIFIRIFVEMLKSKDLQSFLLFIKQILEKTHFKKHKKILFFLFEFIKKLKSLFVLTKTKGFFFDIRGKVGVSGNAKKRHVAFSYGVVSTTTQKIKSELQQITVWTPTGQMGVSCLLQY